jgi:site-specific DNA-methyltransferase (adenine-specific)
MTYQILLGNNLDVLPTLADNSIDSIVTDPPYELGFMGKKWDSSGIAYSVELWQQCLRVLKPGGHLLSFGGTRTYHRVAVAIEDAGFELRDSIAWLYGSGFPKSMDVSKAIDKAAGAEREVIGRNPNSREQATKENTLYESGTVGKTAFDTAPSTPEAQQWQGWGTALKPAFEPVIVARKPIEGTVANNVLKWGTGGLNIGGSRIGYASDYDKKHQEDIRKGSGTFFGGTGEAKSEQVSMQGRWPANVILGHTQSCQPTGKTIKNKTGAGKRTATFGTQDTQSGGDGSGGWSGYEYETEVYDCIDGCPVKALDEQSGISKSTSSKGHNRIGNQVGDDRTAKAAGLYGDGAWIAGSNHNDSGGASRFFYVAKASKRDRNEGLHDLEAKTASEMTGRKEGSAGLVMKHEDGSDKANAYAGTTGAARQNFHPTVKPTSLMEYLVKLVTPPGGTVLDPFTGSGSTGKAAILQGFDFIGIELTEEYLPIIEGRLKYAEQILAEAKEQDKAKESEVLF